MKKQEAQNIDNMNLSEKTIKCVCGGDDDNRRILYHEKDVKEFVKRLKDKQCLERDGTKNSHCNNCLCCNEINELAGDKLNGTKD